jgi:8-oxo-dGTP diphosphatase
MKKVQVVHAIIKQNGKFLLGKRSLSKKNAAGYWASIGGRLEHEESLEDCLIRECSEEIDVIVKPIKKIMEVIEAEAIHYWYDTEIILGIPRLANDEHSELNWFSKLEIETISPIVTEDLEIIRSAL